MKLTKNSVCNLSTNQTTTQDPRGEAPIAIQTNPIERKNEVTNETLQHYTTYGKAQQFGRS
jgi:hypothetical protein